MYRKQHKKTLPWREFCQSSFQEQVYHLMLVNLMLVDTATMNAYNGGWVDFCRTRRLVEGMPVKFIATKPLDNQVIYVKVAADFSMQTTLVQQVIDGKFVPSVVAAQFFGVAP